MMRLGMSEVSIKVLSLQKEFQLQNCFAVLSKEGEEDVE